MKNDEGGVQDILREFESNPFDVSLHTLRSGINASAEQQTDVKLALAEGEKQEQILLQERVFTKQSSIRDTIPENNPNGKKWVNINC